MQKLTGFYQLLLVMLRFLVVVVKVLAPVIASGAG